MYDISSLQHVSLFKGEESEATAGSGASLPTEQTVLPVSVVFVESVVSTSLPSGEISPDFTNPRINNLGHFLVSSCVLGDRTRCFEGTRWLNLF